MSIQLTQEYFVKMVCSIEDLSIHITENFHQKTSLSNNLHKARMW